MADNTFIGKGMKFPPQINPATGRFETSSMGENVKESIYLILMTSIGERFLRPDYGSTLSRYTFMDTDITSVNLMIRQLTQEITTQEPRIENLDITVDATTRQGCLIIDIGYTLIETNTQDNLVFPFYLDNIVEEEEYETNRQYQDGGNYDEPVEEITN